jgi:hypothetical protein
LTALVVIALINVAYVGYGTRMRARLLRGVVLSNLDSAMENGHFAPGGYLHGASPDKIAYDMALHADDANDYTTPELTPYVREWLHSRGWTWSA